MRLRVGVVLCAVVGLWVGCKKGKEQGSGSEARPPQTWTCTSDADCVISCDVPDQCCHGACCRDMVQHREAAGAAAAHNAKVCTPEKMKDCPSVGACAEPTYVVTPRCNAGVCVGERVDIPQDPPAPPPNPEKVDTTDFDRTCKTAADCKVIDDLPCNPCNCSSTSISVKEMDRFHTAAEAVKCGPPPEIDCGECRGYVPVCANGTCTSEPEK